MARKRDPRRDEAFELFKKSNGSITNREIAEKLSVPEKTISAWKSRDKWNAVLQNDNCSTAKNDCSTTNRGGAPTGNKNAKGNKGNSRASPPLRNKNALKTGEFESIYFDTLSEEEKELYSTMNDDPFFVLSGEVRMLQIRQRRMMKRIQDAETGLNDEEIERLQQLRKVKTPVEHDGKKLEIKYEVLKDVQVTRKTYRKIDDILSIEEALTRISNQLSRSLKQLAELEMNNHRAGLFDKQKEKAEAEIRRLKIQNGEFEQDEIGDDGFVEAIKGIANDPEVWSDDDIET